MRGLAIAVLVAFSSAAAAEGGSPIDRFPAQSLVEDFGTELGAAEETPARPMLQIAIDLVKDFEGWSAGAYNDPVGFCTIGYGHLIALKRCEQIELGEFARALTEEEGEQLLERDTRSARAAVASLVTVELVDHQFSAVASFAFNVGKKNFANSTMLKLINAGETDLAAGQFGRWVLAKGEVLPGLVARRACEQTLFLGQLSHNAKGLFDRTLCESLGAAPDVGPLVDIEKGE